MYTVRDMESVLCREVVPFLEGPLTEVPLYLLVRYKMYNHAFDKFIVHL